MEVIKVEIFNLIITFYKEDCEEPEPGESIFFPINRATVLELCDIQSKIKNEALFKEKFSNLVDVNGDVHNIDYSKVYGFEIALVP